MHTEENPLIHWTEKGKYAIIAFLLMAIDKKADENGKVRLYDLFGLDGYHVYSHGRSYTGTQLLKLSSLDGSQPESEERWYSTIEVKGERETRAAMARECELFLDGLPDDKRYDVIQDEIDKFIEGIDGPNLKCAIGDSYNTVDTCCAKHGIDGVDETHRLCCIKLKGGNPRLWDLVRLVVFDDDYNGNKRRLLKHLAQKWDIDGSILPCLEDAAKTLAAIERERRELSESDRPSGEVTALSLELETQEKEIRGNLKKLGIPDKRFSKHLHSINTYCCTDDFYE